MILFHGTSTAGITGAIRTRQYRHAVKPCFCTSASFKEASLFASRKVTLEEMKQGKYGLVYEFEFSGKQSDIEKVSDNVMRDEQEVAVFKPSKLKLLAVHSFEGNSWVRKPKQ